MLGTLGRVVRIAVPGATLALLAPLIGDSSAAQAVPAAPGPSVVSGHSDEVVETRPTIQARRAAGYTAYPVPTSAADLGRITTAADGSMWFVERDANTIGRITTDGVITEFTLPPTTTGTGIVKDLDVDAAGRVWVVWDTGWKITRFDPAHPDQAFTWSLSYPYGEEVRVGPDAVWVTANYDEDGIIRIVGNSATWDANAPECDGALGRGRDGRMWCRQFDNLIRVDPTGTGGTTVPLPDDATYPYSIARGPDRSIWFGRDSGGTMFTSSSSGNIGWVTASGAVTTRRIGDRTAPRSLTTGKDGNVWFTSVGAAKGIGHMNSRGEGAVVKVGNYEPTSVTYGADGAIWFTDSDANTIVRVPRKHLWVTNLVLGGHSELTPHRQPAAKVSGRLDAGKARKKATIKLTCGAGAVPCQGRIQVEVGSKKVGSGRYLLAAKDTSKVIVELTGAARKLLKKRSKVATRLTLRPAAGNKTVRSVILTR